MSSTLTLTSNRFVLTQEGAPEYNDHSSSVLTKPYSGAYMAFFGFVALPKQYYHRLIEHVYFRAYMPHGQLIRFAPITGNWDPATVTWHTKPTTGYFENGYCFHVSNDSASMSYSKYAELDTYGNPVAAIVHGVAVKDTLILGMHTSEGAYQPQLQVVFGDEFKYLEIQSTSPAAGTKVNRKRDLTISFSSTVLPTYGRYVYQLWYKQCKLFWRQAGTTAWNEISQASSTGTQSGQFTIPANTFPSGNIEYYIKTVDSSDHESTSQVVTIDTTDTLSTAICVSPSGTVIDGNSESTFIWKHVNQSGTAQTKADIQISQDGTTWETLGTVTGASSTYLAAAGQMSSGTWYWRVRTYNNDNRAGAWSSPAQFIAVSSPPTPSVWITAPSPRPSIQWQTTEQEAYQLRIAGIIDQTYYGTERHWNSPFYLPDGEYNIEIRTQSRYGMWSAWGSTALVVQNTPGPDIELSLISGNSVVLSWQGSYDFYLVYRNGVPIAKVQDGVYVDDLSIGFTAYQIRGCYKDRNNYGLSPVVDAYVCPTYPIIKPLGASEWQELKYSSEQHQIFKTDYSRDIRSNYMAGRKFPISEASEFYSYTLSFSCAFPAEKRPLALESMMGQIVCVKTPNAEMAIGALSSLPKRTNVFHIEYSISVSNEQYEEEIDIDTGTVL